MNLEPLHRLADVVATTRAAPAIAQAAVHTLILSLQADRVAIFIADDIGNMRLLASQGFSSEDQAAMEGQPPAWAPGSGSPSAIVVPSLRSEFASGLLSGTVYPQGIEALAYIPVLSEGRLLGAIGVYYDTPHAFTAEEVQLAELVAHEVAVGADRIRAEAAVDQLRELLEHERARRGDAELAHHTAEAANVAKSEFLSMLGHELRNPLNALVNAARVIAAVTPDAAPTRAHEVLERQVAHLARLLDDLLDEARISRGLVAIRPALVDLRTPTRFAVEEFAHRIAANAYDFSMVLPADPIMVHGDASRLRQVISNLIDNAIKSTPPQGSIRVALTADRGVALLRIRDTGRGIPADRLAVIFQPFVQGAQDLARSSGGLGLGLSLVRRILELHGGSVRAESAGPGTGAEFIVRIPLAPPTAPR